MSHLFPRMLRQFGAAPAIIFHDEVHTYTDLVEMVDRWRGDLDTDDVLPGQVVALESAYSPQACAALLALIDRETIVVPLPPLPPSKRDDMLQTAQVEVVITIDSAGHRCSRTQRVADHDLYRRLREAGVPGLVLFSSGTSGRSKASVLDFTKVLGRYGPPKSPRRILSFLSLDHIGGINTLFHTLSQGGSIVTVPERTPDVVFAAVAAHRVEVLPTTPTFLNMVLI